MPSSGVQTCADRKSTRLNSSHTIISYAVFCLKKNRSRIRGRRHKAVIRGQQLGHEASGRRYADGWPLVGRAVCSLALLLKYFFFFLRERPPPKSSPLPHHAPFPS